MKPYRQNVLDGGWADGGVGRPDVINPGTGEKLAEQALADAADVGRAVQKIRAGQVFINEWFAGGVETPFGGVAKPGYGRGKGCEALLNHVQTKTVAIAIRQGPPDARQE